MRDRIIKRSALAVCCVMMLTVLHAQPPTYTVSRNKDVSMKLSGTSTFEKWSMEANMCNGNANFQFTPRGSANLTSVPLLTFAFAVSSLKGNTRGMENTAYRSLKEKKFPYITYKLTSSTVTQQKDNRYVLTTHGDLTIAGVTRDVLMDVYCVVNKDRTVTCSGSNKLNMTAYNVKPPTFMGGVMKAGEMVTLDFSILYDR
jgi:polyisoprenoid-binding protein YceI